METKIVKNSAGRKGGRQKGTPNKDTTYLVELCEKLNCDPAEILILIAKGDWQSLGYETPMIEKFGVGGVKIIEHVIQLDHRVDAAKTLMGFIYPKRKSVEIKDDTSSGIKPIVLAYSEEALKKAALDEPK
jgi:hypothetical protein